MSVSLLLGIGSVSVRCQCRYSSVSVCYGSVSVRCQCRYSLVSSSLGFGIGSVSLSLLFGIGLSSTIGSVTPV